LKKKIEQELGVIFKIVQQLFQNIKMVFWDNRKKNYAFSPPSPHPVDELFDGLSGKNFLGHLKKNIVQRNVAKKKFVHAIWG
jgi:hypothetical protein